MTSRFGYISSLLLLICSILIQSPGFGQHFPHKVFKKVDGLPTNVIYDMVEDDQGFLWIATGYGVSKYDGYSFTNFGVDQGLADIDAFAFRKDRFGRIWVIGNSNRLSKIENGRVNAYEYNSILSDHIGVCIDLFVDKGKNLHYSSTTGQIIINDKGEYKSIDSLDNKVKLEIVQSDNGYPLFKSYRSSGPPPPSGHTLRTCLNGKCILTKTKIGHFGRRILNIENNHWLFNVSTDSLVIASNQGIFPFQKFESEIQCLEVIGGDIWVGTADGLMIIEVDDDFQIESRRRIFKNHFFSSIYSDNHGGVWCSTINHGLIYIPQLEFKSYSKRDGIPFDLITAVELDRIGRVYLGGENGNLAVLNPNGTSFLLPNIINNKRRIRDLYLMTDGNIYFDAYQAEAYRIDPDLKIHRIKIQLGEKSSVKYLHEGESGLFASTGRGISRIQGNNIILPKKNNLIRINSFCEINDSVFYTATNEGISCYNIYTDSIWNPFPEFIQRVNTVNRFGQKSFVFATDGNGIFFIHNDSLINIGKNFGLNKLFFQKLRVRDEVIWGITKHGLTKFNIKSLDPLEFSFEEFDYKDGLGYGRLLDLKLVDSLIYLASTEGLIVFKEKDLQLNLDPPKIILNKVLSDGIEIHHEDPLTSVQGPANIEFSFTGLDFNSGGDVLYKYKLIGLNGEWSYTRGRQLQFNSLPSGKYEFLVASRNHKNIWSEEVASFVFKIVPPFWQTWWFYILEALFGSLIIFSLVNWRIRYLHGVEVKREKEEREKAQLELDALKHQMNPHFLFNTLNSIQAFVSSSDRNEAVRYLSRFSRLIRRNLEHSKDTNVSLKEEIDFLQIYLDLERMRFDNAFDYEIGVDGIQGLDRIRIPNLIVQPYVENAVLHGMNNLSRKGYIKVDFSFEEDKLKCVIEDNGVGRIKEKEDKGKGDREHKSVGMTITQRRLKLLNAKIVNPKVKVIDLKENGAPAGTRIEIVMPYLIE